MAKQVIWSRRSHDERIEILTYWNERNKSTDYSKKLNRLFNEAIKLISIHPNIGKRTNDKKARIKIIRDYLMIYELNEMDQIVILTIWDSRQEPEKLP